MASCAPEDGIRKMASLTARNRLFHDIVPDFRDRPAMENRVRFSYACLPRKDLVCTGGNALDRRELTARICDRGLEEIKPFTPIRNQNHRSIGHRLLSIVHHCPTDLSAVLPKNDLKVAGNWSCNIQ